ncbi:MAG: ABC transporter permease subunit [Actinobacteria bacterium]|nr:ABC transporter permease subunit [Actinomycetota bacterium]
MTTTHGTLPLRVEAVRQLRRRRTVFALGFLVLLPFLLIGAFQIAGTQDTQPGQVSLVDLATSGAVNFAIFTLFASAGFLLVVIVALFCGDTVASEASWSTLRYLLAAPVPRGRLLRQKLLVALGYSVLSLLLLPAVALVSGWVVYGWTTVRTPLGDSYPAAEGLARLGLVVAYLAVWMLTVGSLAFWLSTVTDAPLGAVGGAVGLVIISNILDAITALGSLREVLPTHYQFAWTDALTIPVQYDAMAKGAVASVAYSAVFLVLAWRHFAGKDIVS